MPNLYELRQSNNQRFYAEENNLFPAILNNEYDSIVEYRKLKNKRNSTLNTLYQAFLNDYT